MKQDGPCCCFAEAKFTLSAYLLLCSVVVSAILTNDPSLVLQREREDRRDSSEKGSFINRHMIPQEHIFQVLPAEKLRDIARYLAFDPLVGGKLFSQIAESEKLAWLDAHRNDLEDHLRWVGSSLFGKRRSYREIVLDTAKKVGAPHPEVAATPAVEQAIVSQVWKQAVERMTEEQRAQVGASIAELASKHGKQVGKELSGFAALGAAQLSGFGIYMAGTTLLGAINGALGLGLGFGAFTGLSSVISVVIGPVGWAALGLFTVAKLGGPNYKKLIPVIFVIATHRAEHAATSGTQPILRPRSEHPGAISATTVPNTGSIAPTSSPNEDASVSSATNNKEAEDAATTFPMPDVHALEAEIRQIAEQRQRARLRAPLAAPRKPTKQERRIFSLQNPELCKVAELLDGKHFLEMQKADQEAIREIVREQQEYLCQEEKRRKQEAQKTRRAQEKAAREGSKKKRDIDRQKKEFGRLLLNLVFSDGALERYLGLDDDRRFVALEQLKQLDSGNFRDKHDVPGTRPRLFQRDGGSDVRIYYRRDGAPNRFFVHLVGTKATQSGDYKNMRC
jgi:uncharacterized protein YaaW (UPF0174 family)